MSGIKLGITLYSFTAEYCKGMMSLEDCVRTAAKFGAEGYELVATQMLPDYPYVSDDFIGKLNEYTLRYGIAPICYGANTDRGMRFDRDLTEDEMVAMSIQDIRNAYRMGCKVVRAQYLLSPSALVKLSSYAEKYDIKVGIEIHNPETPSTPIMKEYLKAIKESGSSHIGFIPDFGCFATRPNKPQWDMAVKNGAPEELLQMAAQLRYKGVGFNEAVDKLEKAGANEAVFSAVQGMYGFVTFYDKPDLQGLEEIMPYCFHFHGKFHYLDANNIEASIPYPEILEVIYASGYEGYIMSEFEDHESGRALEMTKKHIEMERNILKTLKEEQHG